jgi:hypothetical protein
MKQDFQAVLFDMDCVVIDTRQFVAEFTSLRVTSTRVGEPLGGGHSLRCVAPGA